MYIGLSNHSRNTEDPFLAAFELDRKRLDAAFGASCLKGWVVHFVINPVRFDMQGRMHALYVSYHAPCSAHFGHCVHSSNRHVGIHLH